MSEKSRTDWDAFDAITPEQAEINALNDPDAASLEGKPIEMRESDGCTLLERLHKALERERHPVNGRIIVKTLDELRSME